MNYAVGDVLRVIGTDGVVRRVVVTARDKFEGWDGFVGYYEQTGEEVWGFDLQISSRVRKEGKRAVPLQP